MASMESISRRHVETAAATEHGVGGRVRADDLVRRWRRTGDERWRSLAIEAYMPLAQRIARRFHAGPEPLEDLLQIAYLGLVKAVDRFDPEASNRFGSYAIPTITGELRRHFRDATWSVHVPRGVKDDSVRVGHVTSDLSERLGRAPTVGELSEATGLDAEQITEALHARRVREMDSLDQPVSRGSDRDTALGELIGETDDSFDLIDHRATLAPALRALPPRERELLFMRFALDMTQTEIGERLGCSQMQVSRLLRRVLDRLSAIDMQPEPSESIGSSERRDDDRRVHAA